MCGIMTIRAMQETRIAFQCEYPMALMRQLDPIAPGEIRGVAIFPLHMAPVDLDIILIYGTPAQMARLAAGYLHHFDMKPDIS